MCVRKLAAILILLVALGGQASPVYALEPHSLTIATVDFVGDMHRIVAQDAVMTSEDLTRFRFHYWAYGKLALDDVLQGGADIAMVTSFPVVRTYLTQSTENVPASERIQVVANLYLSHDTHFVIANTHAGIRYPQDLEGKRVGVTPNSLSEFLFERFAEYFGVDLAQVERVKAPINTLEDQLDSGALDAGLAWNPTAQTILDHGPQRYIRLPSGAYHIGTWVIVAKAGTVAEKGALIEDFLATLIEAETRYYFDRDDSERLLANRLGLETGDLNRILQEYTFQMSLNEPLISSMHSIQNWMCAQQSQIGCFTSLRELIYPDLLRTLRPETVRLLGKN